MGTLRTYTRLLAAASSSILAACILAACILAACILGACATRAAVEPRPLRPGFEAAVYAAERALERGDPGAAGLVEGAVRLEPEAVDTRRLRQNLRIAAGESWQVYVAAKTERDAHPGDPAAIYLYARTIPDRRVQRQGFEEAVRCDPSFFFGHYGLAVSALAVGDVEEAGRAAASALSIRPRSVDAALLDAEVLARAGDVEGAAERLGLLARTHPDHVRAVFAAAEHLLRAGSPGAALSLALLGLAARPDTPAYFLLAARIVREESVPEAQIAECLAVARRGGAGSQSLLEAAWRAGAWRAGAWRAGAWRVGGGRVGGGRARPSFGDLPSASIDGVVSGAIQDLDYARAAAVLRASAPPDLIPGAADSRRSAAVRLEDALDGAAARPRDPEVLADLARALLASGFAGEAVTVGARALAESPGSAALQELLAAAASWRTLLMAVERTVELHYRRSGDSTDLSGLLAELGGLSERVLGEDIFSDLPIVRFPLVGAVTRTDAPGAPEIWSERGVLLVLGYRSGVGVEGTMARLVLRCESVELEGGPHDVAFVRGVRLASRTERSGSAVGGFTLPGWLAVDLDIADRGAGEVRRIAGNAARWEAEAQWPAAGRDEQLSLWFPGDIRGRLARRLEDPRRAVLAATLAHERGHVLDVRRYFPFLPHLPEILLGFARAGFSPARAEVELERAAERRALLSSENRTAALLNTLGALPFRDDAPPHSIAYAELVDEIVATLGDNLGSYPAIDPGLNLLQQLDRLSEAELADLLDRALR